MPGLRQKGILQLIAKTTTRMPLLIGKKTRRFAQMAVDPKKALASHRASHFFGSNL
jgi:hypothetical protein